MLFQPARSAYLERALLDCAWLAKRRLQWDDETRLYVDRLEHALSIIYGDLAFLQARSSGGTVADEHHPGYLIASSDGIELRVPFHIFEALPRGDALREIVELAGELRSFDASTICISGSYAMYDGLGAVTDIDLCEYVPFDARARATLLPGVKHAENIDGDRASCFAIHLFELRYNRSADANDVSDYEAVKRPWPGPPSAMPRIARLLPRARKAKFDYLAKTDGEGLVVVTNIALLIEGSSDAALLESHPSNELPVIFDGATVPRRLSDPVAVGRYISFLCDQVDARLEDSLNKAAKRAYALARLLTRDRDANAIAKTMREEGFFLDAAIAARLQVAREILKLPESVMKTRLVPEMVNTLRRLCDRSTDPRLGRLLEDSKDLDDLQYWINNLDHYMHTKSARADRIRDDLRAFVEGVREQIAAAGA